MSTLNVSLPTPSDFSAFPYLQPYGIQKDLMQCLYSAIEGGKVAIVESPTGTGKTLSLLCASLTWLFDNKSRSRKGILDEIHNTLRVENEPDWVFEQTYSRMKNELEALEAEYEQHLRDIRRKERELKVEETVRAAKRRRRSSKGEPDTENEDSFLPDDRDISQKAHSKPDILLSESLCNKGMSAREPAQTGTKIYYASRTHSQLTQVFGELRKLKLTHPTAVADNAGNKDDLNASEVLPRSVTLASRTHLCLNDALRKRTTDLDEGCRDLLNGSPADRCPFLPPIGDETRMLDMRDRILASPKDIEDLVSSGRDAQTCPYFASRSAVPLAELVAVPYNLLLHKGTREAVGLDLTDQVVIIDEAHNLIDTILQLHTVELSSSMLGMALDQLRAYLERFRTRLTATHALQLRRLVQFLSALQNLVNTMKCGRDQAKEPVSMIMPVTLFTERLGTKVNDINLLDLQSYLKTSKVIRKISGYTKKRLEDNSEVNSIGSRSSGKKQSTTVPLQTIESFIAGLTNNTEDGRVSLFRASDEQVIIKYQHLNASTHFNDIAQSARCVVLAGGTMSPLSDVTMQLFPDVPAERLSTFSCGHVIPTSNLQGLVIGKGPRGKELSFTFKNRNDQQTLTELGQILLNLVNVVPRGLVVFLPSYAFLDAVKKLWTDTGLIDRLQRKKQVFYEPLDSTAVEKVLREYSASVISQSADKPKGAILFAVVGAKLSEGLNFADDLARAVVIVGLPFPNSTSPELKERMRYITELDRAKHGNGTQTGKNAGQELYENICMRAVNQSIGRAIRHQRDWAALIFIDARYSSPRIRDKLPQWINSSTNVMQSFGQAVKTLAEFFQSKK